MAHLSPIPFHVIKQTYTAADPLTLCNGTHTNAIRVPLVSLHPTLQENALVPDAEKVLPITGVFNHNGALTLFYAEDDPDDADIFRNAITQINPYIKLHSVDSGYALCELLTHIQPDMIFLDLDMPAKNGLECMVDIRNNTLYKTLPIVVYSSTTRPSNIHTAYEMGADLFFIKPFVYGDLLSSLKAILCLDWHAPAKIKEQYLINNSYTAFSNGLIA